MKYIATLLFFLVFTCAACSEVGNPNKAKQSLYQNIIDKRKIRVGYISYPPSYIIDGNNSHSGIFHDVFEEVAKNLGIEIQYSKEVTWAGMVQDLKDYKIDIVVTGIWPTTQRGKQADFLEPLFYSPVKAYTYYGNTRFDNNIKSANKSDVKISTVDGEMTQIIATADFASARQVAVAQMAGVSQALLDLKDKKSDIIFVEPIIALEFLEKNPNSIQEIKGVGPLRVFPNCIMVPKGQEDLKSTLNIALRELIYSGFVDKTIAKYEKYPNSYYRSKPSYQSPPLK